jgi:ABC-type dipeptide/oligopeptide/nickel transport system ATPase component
MSFNSGMSSAEAHGRNSLLSARELSIEYMLRSGAVPAVENFSLDIGPGEIVGLIGETGSGKSTAAHALIGLVRRPGRITSGVVLFEGQNLLTLPSSTLRKIRGADFSLIVQQPKSALNPLMRVGDQIAAVCASHADLTRAEARSRAVEALASVGISDAKRRYRAYPHELSGGMAQRVMIAMATVNQPRIVIADEPTTGLDVTVQAQILSLLRQRVQTTDASAVLVSHDLGVIAHYCDRAAVMLAGRIVEMSDVSTLFARPQHEYTRRLLAAAPKLEWLAASESHSEVP